MPDTAAFPAPLLILALWPAHSAAALRLQAAWPGARQLGLAEAAAALRVEADSRLLVLAPPPGQQIAAALAAGQTPAAAVQGWRATVEPLLGLLRSQRRRVLLALIATPEEAALAEVWARCAERLGRPGARLPPAPAAPPPLDAAAGSGSGPDLAAEPLLLLAAATQLRADAEAQALAEELEASALWSPAPPPGAAGGGAAGMAAGPDPAPLITALVRQQQEILLLRAQVRLDAGLRAALGAQVEALVRERDTLAEQLHKAAQAATAQQGQLAGLQQEHRLLEGYFETAQRLAAEVGQLSGQLEDSRHQAAWLGEEIQRIHRARSYRLMAPLRRLRGLAAVRG